MLDELADVLTRPFAAGRHAAAPTVLAALRACSRVVDPPPAAAPFPPRCSDPDDQKFVDLAWHWPVQWLVSRDRAVLKLARSARARGLAIITPARWAEVFTA